MGSFTSKLSLGTNCLAYSQGGLKYFPTSQPDATHYWIYDTASTFTGGSYQVYLCANDEGSTAYIPADSATINITTASSIYEDLVTIPVRTASGGSSAYYIALQAYMTSSVHTYRLALVSTSDNQTPIRRYAFASVSSGSANKVSTMIGYDGSTYYLAATPYSTSSVYMGNGLNARITDVSSLLAQISTDTGIADPSIGYYEYTSADYGSASTESGYGQDGDAGSFDDTSDTISIPTTPTYGVTTAGGFVNVYSLSSSTLSAFGAELFPDLSFTPISSLPTPTSVTDALVNIAEVLVNFGNQIPAMIDMYINNTLIQYVLDCHILPVTPSTSGSDNIKVGFKNFTPTADLVTSDYIDFDCGDISIAEYYANFADYSPYTSAKLFLPFVGFVDILPEYWQSGTLNVTYRFNVIDGSFMAFVKSTSSKSNLSDSVIAQYGGNACIHVPITGANYSNLTTGLMSAAASMVSAPSGASALMGGAASALNAVATRGGMQSSNGYNSTSAFLGIRVPYLLIERTVSDFSASYDDEVGIPSNISTSFSSLSGFTSSSRVILDGITGATSEELDEISSLLASGVIL